MEKQSQQNEHAQNVQPKNKQFCIGILVSETNLESIRHYNEQFRLINKRYKNRVKLLFFGYNPEKDPFKSLEGVDYDYVKNVSIIHQPKQFNACEINLLFVPLVKNGMNASSEDIDEFLFAGIFKIPILVCDIYPFNKVVQNDVNGFIYKDREAFYPYLEDLLRTRIPVIELAGKSAYIDVTSKFNFSDNNLNKQLNVFC